MCQYGTFIYHIKCIEFSLKKSFDLTTYLLVILIKIAYVTLFTRGDDNYEAVSINFSFNYFGTLFSQLTLNTNGYVSFGNANNYNAENAISGLAYDLDTRYGGGIYYQNLNSQSSDFNSIKSDLNRLNSNFVPTNLFRIIYDNVPNYVSGGSLGSLRATFQIILASDALKSFVLLKYTSCLSGNLLRAAPGLYYLSSNGQQMSNTLTNPCTNSNVNLGGTWVFDVSPLLSKRSIIFLISYNKVDPYATMILF